MIYEMYMTKGNARYIKIGQTQDLKKRMLAYITHNPFVKLIGTMDFSGFCSIYEKGIEREMENNFHKLLKDLHFQQVRKTEWYRVPIDFSNKDILLDNLLNEFPKSFPASLRYVLFLQEETFINTNYTKEGKKYLRKFYDYT